MRDIPESAQTQCERLLEHLKLCLPLTAHKALYGYCAYGSRREFTI